MNTKPLEQFLWNSPAAVDMAWALNDNPGLEEEIRIARRIVASHVDDPTMELMCAGVDDLVIQFVAELTQELEDEYGSTTELVGLLNAPTLRRLTD